MDAESLPHTFDRDLQSRDMFTHERQGFLARQTQYRRRPCGRLLYCGAVMKG